MEFKGTKGEWEPFYISGICMGVAVDDGNYREVICNSLIPDTDKEYAEQEELIIADMTLMASSKVMLDALQQLLKVYEEKGQLLAFNVSIAKRAVELALGQEGLNGY